MKLPTINSPESKQYYLRHLIPVVVWLSAVAIIFWLLYTRYQRFQVIGIARAQIVEIAADATGRIQRIPVELFQQVKAGDTVAIVDTIVASDRTLEAELKTKLATSVAEIEHLASQLVPTQETLLSEASDLEISRADNERRFSMDVESTRLKILELRAMIASDQISAGDLGMEVKTCEDLLEKKVIVPYELERAKVQHEGLCSKIQENQRLLEQAQTDLKEAEARRAEFTRRELKHPSVDSAIEVIRKEMAVQEELMNGLVKELEALQARRSVELTTPIDGVIVPIQVNGRTGEVLAQRPGEAVIRRPGEVIGAGSPILMVASRAPTEIVAYVSEQMVGRVRENMPVNVIKTRPKTQVVKANVVRLGPTVELIPQRLWRNPAYPQWGLPIIVSVPEGLELLPGEAVGICGL
jgi:multidrug resistance efflux pump